MLVLLVAVPVVAEPWDIPPPPKGHWAKDQTGKVSAGTLLALDQLAARLDVTGLGQLGVLVTDTTSGVKPRDFATGVFNSWGIGHASSNDGVLIFVAVGDRKAEIILGTGSHLTPYETDIVMRDDVVAHMKQGSLDQALLSAAQSLERLHQPKQPPSELYSLTHTPEAPEVDSALAALLRGEAEFPERSPRSWVVDLSETLTPSQRAQLDVAASDVYASDRGRIFFLIFSTQGTWPTPEMLARRFLTQVTPLSRLPVAVVVLDLNTQQGFLEIPGSHDSWERRKIDEATYALGTQSGQNPTGAMQTAAHFATEALTSGIPSRPTDEAIRAGIDEHPILSGGGGLFAALSAVWFGRRWNRRRTRTCQSCHHPRQLLPEEQEDQHLSATQVTEESIGSIDYDVWWCGRCKDVLVLDYSRFFSGYSKCPGCSAKTWSSNTTTLQAATTYSGGLEEVNEQCANCDHKRTYTRATARLPDPSDSSSSSSSSSSGSFGGGSSSGSGSSGSW